MYSQLQFIFLVFIFATRHQQIMDYFKTMIILSYAAAATHVIYVYGNHGNHGNQHVNHVAMHVIELSP